MNNVIKSLLIMVVVMLSSFSIVCNASIINHTIKQDIVYKNTNKEIYLGYAKINGNGSNSILEVVGENNLLVGIEDKTSYIDFYIDYDMNCSGDADNGQIWLAVAINGHDMAPALVTAFTSENGTLKIENKKVNRSDSFSFIIKVIYASAIPLYKNETEVFGAGVFSKSGKYIIDIDNQFYQIIGNLVNRFPFFEKILNQYY